MVLVAEPPKLSRLKYASHYQKGNISLNTLQTEQLLVCRVTSRYNHRFSGRTSIPRTKASPEILQPQFLQQKHNKDYKLVQIIITKKQLKKNSYTGHKGKVTEFKQRKIKHDGYNTSQNGTKLAQARYHSPGSLPAEDVSHSTDQPGGKEQG